MKLEGIDPKHPSLFCVLTVAEVRGYRLRLHFDGYSECYDFWVNADSLDIQPAGWCEKTNHKLQYPKGMSFNPLTSLHQRPYKHAVFLERPIGERLNAHSDFCVFWREALSTRHVCHAMPCHAMPSWRLTCIHAIPSRSPWVHGSVAPDKRHCKQ